MKSKGWKELVARLRRQLPLPGPVSVRFERFGQPHAGDCTRLSDGRYRVRIDPRQPVHEQVSTLLHELAHVLAWPLDGGCEHGEWFDRAKHVVFLVYLGVHPVPGNYC